MADDAPRILFEPGRVRVTGRGLGGIKVGGGKGGGGKGGGKGGGRAAGLSSLAQAVSAFGAIASAHTPSAAVPPPSGPAFRAAGHAQGATIASLLSVLPAGLASGDTMIMCVSIGTNSRTVTTPAGWTQISSSPSALGGFAASESMAVFYRVAGGAESAPTVSVSGSCDFQIDILAFTGVDAVTPVEVNALGAWLGASNTVYAFPTVTTLAGGDGILLVSWDDSGSGNQFTITGPAGYTTISQPSGIDRFTALLGSKSAAGATGALSVTYTVNSKKVGFTIGLKKA